MNKSQEKLGFSILASELEILKPLAKLSSKHVGGEYGNTFRISTVGNSVSFTFSNLETTASVRIPCIDIPNLQQDDIFIPIDVFLEWLNIEKKDTNGSVNFVYSSNALEVIEEISRGSLARDHPEFKMGDFISKVKISKIYHKDQMQVSFKVAGNKRKATFNVKHFDYEMPKPISDPIVTTKIQAKKLGFGFDNASEYVTSIYESPNLSSAKIFIRDGELYVSGVSNAWAFLFDTKTKLDHLSPETLSLYPKHVSQALNLFGDSEITLSISNDRVQLSNDNIWVNFILVNATPPDIFDLFPSKLPEQYVYLDPAKLSDALLFLSKHTDYCRLFSEENGIVLVGRSDMSEIVHSYSLKTLKNTIASGTQIILNSKKLFDFIQPFKKLINMKIYLIDKTKVYLEFPDVPEVKIIMATMYQAEISREEQQFLELGREYVQ